MAEIEEAAVNNAVLEILDLPLAILSALTGYEAVSDPGTLTAWLKPLPLKKVQTDPPTPRRPFDLAPLPSLHSS